MTSLPAAFHALVGLVYHVHVAAAILPVDEVLRGRVRPALRAGQLS